MFYCEISNVGDIVVAIQNYFEQKVFIGKIYAHISQQQNMPMWDVNTNKGMFHGQRKDSLAKVLSQWAAEDSYQMYNISSRKGLRCRQWPGALSIN